MYIVTELNRVGLGINSRIDSPWHHDCFCYCASQVCRPVADKFAYLFADGYPRSGFRFFPSRLAGMDSRLEQAAMDLYANERETFIKVTLPLVAPGIAAAALLSFSLSFDDFIITNLNSGSNFTTFPKFIYISAQRGIPAQANVIGSLMFFIALTLVIIGQVAGSRRKK